MKKRVLRFESLEDRRLLAVAAGLETPFPEPTAAVPAGAAVGDVYIASTLDADGDGFIGPAELSYMSHAWFASDGGDRWNPASDLDGDGFVGPGDYALLSSYWFKTNDGLPESTRSYQIYPSDIGNWILFGDQVSKISARGGTLTLDAGGGGLEAVCDYDAFPENLRVTADFKTAGVSAAFQAGIELAVQESGARYCAEIQPDRACLYYVDGSGRMSLLDGAFYTFSPNETYTVWVQKSDSFLSFGVGSGTLISVSDARLSGGQVGFYASEGASVFQNIGIYTGDDLYDTGPTPEEENAELRAEVVAYMRSMATVKWTPAADITYYNPDYGVMFKAGQTYYGVPYSQKVRSGSYESFSSYLNADGVYTGPTGSTSYIGSDCSSAVSMAWRVFDPSLSLLGTYYMFPGRGKIVAVGNYNLTSGSRTAQVVSDNGRDVMYAAYACLQPGDAVLWYKDTGGHVRLITSVDAANQCVYVIEQSGSAGYETPIAGNSTWRVDRKITFASLYDNGYIPISHSGLQIG